MIVQTKKIIKIKDDITKTINYITKIKHDVTFAALLLVLYILIAIGLLVYIML